MLGIKKCLLIAMILLVSNGFGSNYKLLRSENCRSLLYFNYTSKDLVGRGCSSKEIAMVEKRIEENRVNFRDFYLIFYLIDDQSCIVDKRVRIQNVLFKLIIVQPNNFLSAFRRCPERLKIKLLTIMKTSLIKKTRCIDALFSILDVKLVEYEQEIDEITSALRKGLLSIEKEERISEL